jgi:Fur family zinc uptake transcriptional regulator
MRRQVLETLLASHRPLGACIETRNAFVVCVHNHGGDDLVIFLICERCGAVGAAPGGTAAEAFKASSRAAGFSPKSPVIEIAGICSHCRGR